MKQEVQSRIENQRKLMTYLHDAGSRLEDSLLSKFDQEMTQVQDRVTEIDQSFTEWEPQLLQSLTNNRQNLQQFEIDTKQSLQDMSHQLQNSFKSTERYESLVISRSKEFEERVYDQDLKKLEYNRDTINMKMTQTVLEFNFKVQEEVAKLEEQTKCELAGMRHQLVAEQQERKTSDQVLLQATLIATSVAQSQSNDMPQVNKVFNMFKKFVTHSDNQSPSPQESARTSMYPTDRKFLPSQVDPKALKSELNLQLGALKDLQSEEELAEIQKSYKENHSKVDTVFQQLTSSNTKQEGKALRIKITDLPIFIAKLEEIIGIELDQLQSFISESFYLRRSKYYITGQDLSLAIDYWVQFTNFKRKKPRTQEKPTERSKQQTSLSVMSGTPIKQRTFLTAYTPRTNEPKEVQKVQSLQLLVYKISTHKDKIKSYIDFQKNPSDTSPKKDNDLLSLPPNKVINKKYVKLEKLAEIMQNVMIIAGMKLCTYEAYVTGKSKSLKEIEKEVVDKFTCYLYQQLRMKAFNFNYQKQTSIVKKEGQNKKKDLKVVFTDELMEIIQQEQTQFTSDDFLFYIDKFQANENSVVCLETDGEYQKHLEKLKKDDEQLNQVGNDLDDFLFSSGSDTEKKGKQISSFQQENKDFIAKNQKQAVTVDKQKEQKEEENYFQKHMEKTIHEYEQMLENNSFKNENDKKETVKLLNTLKSQLNQHVQRNNKLTQSQQQAQTQQESKQDLAERRKRGLMEIFHFYTRQHIPQNRQFDDLKDIMSEINLGEFMIFCKDFAIPLTKAKLTEIFKKNSTNNKSHKLDQFTSSICKIGSEINKEKIEEAAEKIREVNKLIKKNEYDNKKQQEAVYQLEQNVKRKEQQQLDEQINSFDKSSIQEQNEDSEITSVVQKEEQEETSRSNLRAKNNSTISVDILGKDISNSVYNKERSKLNQELGRLQKIVDTLEKKPEQETTNDIMELLECDDPNKYRKKIKGFHMAFNIRDKIKITDEEKSKYKFQPKVPIEDMKKNLEELKNKRQLDKIIKEKDEQIKQERDREALRKMHEQLRKEKQKGGVTQSVDGSVSESYKDLRIKKQLTQVDANGKITFAGIHKMHYSQLNTGLGADDFRPSDIVDEDNTIEHNHKPFDSDEESLNKLKKDTIPVNNPQIVKNLHKALQYNQKAVHSSGNKFIRQSTRLDNTNKMLVNASNTQGNSPATDQKVVKRSLKHMQKRLSQNSITQNNNNIDDVMQSVKSSGHNINFVQQQMVAGQSVTLKAGDIINKSVNYLPINPITYRDDSSASGGNVMTNIRNRGADKPPKRGGQPLNQINAVSARSRKIFKEHSIDSASIGAPYRDYNLKYAQNSSSINQSMNNPVSNNRGSSLPQQQPQQIMNPKIFQSMDTSQYYADKTNHSQLYLNGLGNSANHMQSQKRQSNPKLVKYQQQLQAVNNQHNDDQTGNAYYSPLRTDTKGEAGTNKPSIISRVEQIAQQSKKTEQRSMNGVLKMHDKQIKKGLIAANR